MGYLSFNEGLFDSIGKFMDKRKSESEKMEIRKAINYNAYPPAFCVVPENATHVEFFLCDFKHALNDYFIINHSKEIKKHQPQPKVSDKLKIDKDDWEKIKHQRVKIFIASLHKKFPKNTMIPADLIIDTYHMHVRQEGPYSIEELANAMNIKYL